MRILKNPRRLMTLALALAILASLTLGSATGLAVTTMDVIKNGNFEGGFVMIPGCGMVGSGWGCFNNGGRAAYGFFDDQWQPVVADGVHSQLIEINTKQYAASESDRYAGIYQAVVLTKGSTYALQIKGGMREHQPDPLEDKYRYRVQWGYTTDGSTDWTQVTNWVELPWDKIDERTAPTGLQSFATSFTAPSSKITLFIRAWKKWGNAYKELDVNIDAVSLTGQVVRQSNGLAGSIVVLSGPAGDKSYRGPGSDAASVQGKPGVLSCSGKSLLSNGNFEGGFVNGVGKNWQAYNNGGAAAYGFYDEMWTPLVKDGTHGQFIEINTWGLAGSQADRFAGIYQVVGGLKSGATYEISASGTLREEAAHSDEDSYRYRVQWGYAPADADPSAEDITNWTELPWDTIYVRSAPGSMSSFSARFAAPSGKMVVAFRAWKKWGTAQRELDVNLDAINLVRCSSAGSPVSSSRAAFKAPTALPIQAVADSPIKVGICHYTIQAGDALSEIAVKYETTAEQLAAANGIRNANILMLGQRLVVPCPGTPSPQTGGAQVVEAQTREAQTGDACSWHVVQRGDALTKLAADYSTTVKAIAQQNDLSNVDLIYVGQRLCMP